MISRERCLEALEWSAIRIAGVAEENPTGPVPRYPGSDVESLVRHVVTIHEWVTGIVTGLLEEAPMQATPGDDLVGARLQARFDTAWRTLYAALEAADPAAPVWTFGSDRTVAFWLRRMAHETALHAWDADSAITPQPAAIPLDLAVTGLGEGLRIHVSRPLRRTEVGGMGETVGLTCTDADADWTITLQPVGVVVRDGIDHPDARLAGTASDLWLAIGGRTPSQPIARFGSEIVLADFDTALSTIRPAM